MATHGANRAKRDLHAPTDEESELEEDSGEDAGSPSSHKRKSRDKFSKGLRHFSMRLCKKVEEKVMTTFNEVADEIVAEFAHEGGKSAKPNKSHSEKNIRRRVYDALNVLMAMEVITKVKKQITWKGLPSNTRRDLDMAERQILEKQQVIAEKRQHLEELLVQSISYHNLVEKNKRCKLSVRTDEKIPIPFVIVNTSSSTRVELEISENRSDVFMNFNEPFEIHDYSEVLKRLNMHRVDLQPHTSQGSGNSAAAAGATANDSTSRADTQRLGGIVPEHLVPYVPESVFGRGDDMGGEDAGGSAEAVAARR